MPTTNSLLVARTLRNLFSRFDLPKSIIVDNATYFTSTEFVTFLEQNGIKLLGIPPYNPESNGAAVKTLKGTIMKCLNKSKSDSNPILARLLFDYLNTLHCTSDGMAPSLLMFNKRLRTRFDLTVPNKMTAIP